SASSTPTADAQPRIPRIPLVRARAYRDANRENNEIALSAPVKATTSLSGCPVHGLLSVGPRSIALGHAHAQYATIAFTRYTATSNRFHRDDNVIVSSPTGLGSRA